MTISWQRGLALAVVLTMTASASAQGPKKDFKKPLDGGNRGASEVDRVRAEVRALEGQIDRLRQQVEDSSRKLERMQAAAKPKMQEKGKFEFKGPPMAGRGPGMDSKTRFGEMGKGGPPGFGFGGAMAGSFGGRSEFQPKRDGFGPDSRFDSRGTTTSRSPSADLEIRVDRLERAVDELRREVRYRR